MLFLPFLSLVFISTYMGIFLLLTGDNIPHEIHNNPPVPKTGSNSDFPYSLPFVLDIFGK